MKKSSFWSRLRERNVLRLFHAAALRVPAYRDFLRKEKINPQKIKTWDDFQSVTPIDKKNYLRHYSLQNLCWDGSLAKPMVFTATSGSTGRPVYFLRQEQLDWQYSLILEEFLRRREDTGPTLVIVGFGMGLWIAGVITYKAFELAAHRTNGSISIITPGINKKEVFGALKNLAPHFQQVVLAGYSPFIKDIIDEALELGINMKKIPCRFVFAAEAISEGFRDYLKEHTGLKDVYRDVINIFGSADIGAMAVEDPLCILVRRLTKRDKSLFHKVFSPIEKTPTLAHYNPHFITFEAPQGELLLSGDSAMPLVRYAIGDHGGVHSHTEVADILDQHGYGLEEEIKRVGIKAFRSELPFVYVYERVEMSALFYGLWVYPEWFREALLEKSIANALTGKFTLLTSYDRRHTQSLEVHLELKKGKAETKTLRIQTVNKIVTHLCSHSSEFREITSQLKERAIPHIHFWPYGYSEYFQAGNKQKWVKK